MLLTTAFMLLSLTTHLPCAVTPALIEVNDTPNDWGNSLTVRWKPPLPPDSIIRYEVWRAHHGVSPVEITTFTDSSSFAEVMTHAGWVRAGMNRANDTLFVDSHLSKDTSYVYRLATYAPKMIILSNQSQPLRPERQYLDRSHTNILIATILFIAAVVTFVERARRGASLFIRRIAGLEAIEEAVGRATEMGRPILYVPGLEAMDEVATVAAIDILGQVAKKAGEYGTRLLVPNRDPIVMAVAQQVVRESFSAVGKPHMFRSQDVFYVTFSQFGFAAAVAGLMMREKPATNFFMGRFYAESLVLAETGNATGAIQIAGTDADAQLPFFISACDYTLIGEELYAGSVYLSRQPLLLGALKAQDYAKAIIIGAAIGVVLLYLVRPEIAEMIRKAFG